MLRIAFAFLVIIIIGLIAIPFGFEWIANYPWEGMKIVCAIVLILAALTYLGGMSSRQALRRRAFWEYYGEHHNIRNSPAIQTNKTGMEKSHRRRRQ